MSDWTHPSHFAMSRPRQREVTLHPDDARTMFRDLDAKARSGDVMEGVRLISREVARLDHHERAAFMQYLMERWRHHRATRGK